MNSCQDFSGTGAALLQHFTATLDEEIAVGPRAGFLFFRPKQKFNTLYRCTHVEHAGTIQHDIFTVD